MKYLRIKKNTDYQKLFNKGKKAFSPYISLIYLPSQKTRMGLAVSKKHGNAVRRNRIKRLLRAVFADNVSLLNGGYSVILIPKVRDDYSYADFEKSLKICFKKVNECPQS